MEKNCRKNEKYPRPKSEDIWTTYTKLKKIPCKAMELSKQRGLRFMVADARRIMLRQPP